MGLPKPNGPEAGPVEGGEAPRERGSGEPPPVNPVKAGSVRQLRLSLPRGRSSSRVGLFLLKNLQSKSFLVAPASVTRLKSQEALFLHLQAAGGTLHFGPDYRIIGGAIVFSGIGTPV
ncbi:MAG TPA: hypothetical protein VFX54_06710 [Candidatus Binatia bacterium]|nr:hypothetical protein [Candidatus Binatia bacterium]